jgi:hypothetical protein
VIIGAACLISMTGGNMSVPPMLMVETYTQNKKKVLVFEKG